MIKFEYFEMTGNIREIHGLTGPFDYNLDPGNGLMLYQDIRVIALNAKFGISPHGSLRKMKAITDGNRFSLQLMMVIGN